MKEIYLPTRIIKWIFAAAVVVLLSISVILYLSFSNLFASYNLLNQSNSITLKLEQVISYLKDAENSQRGFLLTNDSMYLEPSRDSQKKVWQLMYELENMISEPHQEKNLSNLRRLTLQRFQRLDSTAVFYAQNHEPARKQMALLQSNVTMDKIRLLVSKMQTEQMNAFMESDKERKKYSQFTPALAIALIITALIIISAAFYQLSRQLSISNNFQKQLSQSNIDLEEKKNELEQSNEELESFNYIASHDLKEPVRKIKTFSSMIMDVDYHKLSEKSKHNFQRLVFAADRLQLLLNDLMAYTRVSAAKEDFSEVDLKSVLQELRESMKESIEENNAVIEAPNLPTIRAIPFQITQLFENLISNSLKYRKDWESPYITIQCSIVDGEEKPEQITGSQEHYHKIVYNDNGIGFSQEYAEKVFELFSRLHSQSNYPGTGIGLTICKKIVQNHKGYIKVQSEKDKGTRFEIYLPV
ncbi:ATP-binding protein [Chitinophagaceae bacterium LB-8]|uniref:histidine kinase n=1 Tax=Paraflavisolibacter caeni TaxID=2982496 RepID=A0A9X2XUV8_9BACT|nr:sensor histidine kinase [Paraflavisolibacter caeni]MCU7548223.1 ATP-binding protein [Paraflavisolibacter caeni]